MRIKKHILCSDLTADSISVPGYVTHTIWLLRATTSTITHQTHSKRLGRRCNMLYCEITRLDVFILHLARARQANTDRQRSLVARAVQPPPIGVTPPDKPLRRCLLCVPLANFCSPCGNFSFGGSSAICSYSRTARWVVETHSIIICMLT